MKLSFRERWLKKACKITGKSLQYICYSDETYDWAVETIRNSGTIKPNRIINKLRDYRKELNNGKTNSMYKL